MIFISSFDSHLSIMLIKITAYYHTRKWPVCRLAESCGDIYMLQDISFLIMRMTQHCLQEQRPHSRSLWITISTGFPSVSSVSSSLSYSHPPHPSLKFWLSKTSRRQGHLTAVAVETEIWGILFYLPLFFSGTARQGGVWWGAGRSEKHEGVSEVKKGILLAAILVEMRLNVTLLAAAR